MDARQVGQRKALSLRALLEAAHVPDSRGRSHRPARDVPTQERAARLPELQLGQTRRQVEELGSAPAPEGEALMALRTMDDRVVDEVKEVIAEELDLEWGGELEVSFGRQEIKDGTAKIVVFVRPEAYGR